MRKFFGKFVSVTLAAVVIAMFALSSDEMCIRDRESTHTFSGCRACSQ